jgi:hypothetical protein
MTPDKRTATLTRRASLAKERLKTETTDHREARLANQRRLNAAARIRETPDQRVTRIANSSGYNKANADTKHAELAARFQESGTSVPSTAFGLGEVSREDEIPERVQHIMLSSAGILHPRGDATSNNWVRDHGEHMSIRDVLSGGGWAAYFLVTIQKITPGKETKCVETTKFLTDCQRNPLWRVDTSDIDMERDLRRFTQREAKSIVHSYLLSEFVSAYDCTSIEGGLQAYIEDEIGIPHGICLHKRAGAGSRMQYSYTHVENARIKNGEACIHSVALSMIRISSPTYASVDASDAERSPPLTSCTVRSHDGKTTYKVCVRGDKQQFPDTKSVLADNISNTDLCNARVNRKRKRKAAALSPTSDADGLDEQGEGDVTSDADGLDDEVERGDRWWCADQGCV